MSTRNFIVSRWLVTPDGPVTVSIGHCDGEVTALLARTIAVSNKIFIVSKQV